MKTFEPVARGEVPSEDAMKWPIGVRESAARNPSRAFADIWPALGAFEWVTLAYLVWLNLVLVLFHDHLAHAREYLAIHCWMALGIVGLAWRAAQTRHAAVRLARDWYPLPLYLFFFEKLGGLVHIVSPGWFDRWLIEFDFAFAGVHPSVWLARFSNPALNDFMQFAYMTYFLYLVILPAILYAHKDRLAFWNVIVATAVANYSVYVVALLFPIESPYYTLAAENMTPLTGGFVTATIGWIERFGRVHGGCISIGARGWIDGCDAGVVEVPAVALLGLPAIFHWHVRFDCVRAVSLRRRYVGGNRGGRDRLRGGKLADGAKGRTGGSCGIVRRAAGGACASRWRLRRPARSRAGAPRSNSDRSFAGRSANRSQ